MVCDEAYDHFFIYVAENGYQQRVADRAIRGNIVQAAIVPYFVLTFIKILSRNFYDLKLSIFLLCKRLMTFGLCRYL